MANNFEAADNAAAWHHHDELLRQQGEQEMNEYKGTALVEKMRAIAEALGEGWRVDDEAAVENQTAYYGHGILIGPALQTSFGSEPRRIYFSQDGTKPERFEIIGQYPSYKDIEGGTIRLIARDLLSYPEREAGERPDRIGASLSRSPNALAADIRRRLLPGYDDLLARALERCYDAAIYAAKVQAGLDVMAEAAGCSLPERGCTLHPYGDLPTMRIMDGRVRFEHMTLPLGVAEEVVKLIRGRVQ